jgi:hypothetical protein
LVAMLRCGNAQVAALEHQLTNQFSAHPDAVIVRSQPGLGVVLGARVLASSATPQGVIRRSRDVRRTPAPPRSPCPRAADDGARPSGVQSAAGGCLLPVGVRGADGLTRRPALL